MYLNTYLNTYISDALAGGERDPQRQVVQTGILLSITADQEG